MADKQSRKKNQLKRAQDDAKWRAAQAKKRPYGKG